MSLPPLPQTPAARVVADRSGAPNLSPVFRALAVVLAATGVLILVRRLAYSRLRARMMSRDFDDYDSIGESFELYGLIFPPLFLGLMIALSVLLFILWQRQPSGRARKFAGAAFVALALVAVVKCIFIIGAFAEPRLVSFLYENRLTALALEFLYPAGPALIISFLLLRGGSRSLAYAGFGCLAFCLLANLVFTLKPQLLPMLAYLDLVIYGLPWAAAFFIAAALAWAPKAMTASTLATATLSGRGWAPAANGLNLYAKALIWRLVLTILGYLILVVTLQGSSVGAAKTIAWALPLTALITGALMTFGVFQFSQQPSGARGTVPALVAAVLMAIALLFDLLLFLAVLKLLAIDTNEYGALREARDGLESAQSAAVWGMALSFAAFAALLAAFYKVATDLGATSLARHCVSVGTLVVFASIVAVVSRLWLGSESRVEPDVLLLAGALSLVATLAAVIAYLTLVNRMQHRIADEVLRLERAEPERS